MEVQKWLRTVKRLLCCGFQCTGKAMGQVYECWWRICREINIFSRFEYNMFYVLYPFATYLLTLLYYDYHLLGDDNHHSHRRGNLKSYSLVLFLNVMK
jgi:hypothetical protein